MELYKVNVLKNVMDTNMDDVRDILKVFEKIKSGSINKKIEEIRNSNDKAVINKLKESLLHLLCLQPLVEEEEKKW